MTEPIDHAAEALSAINEGAECSGVGEYAMGDFQVKAAAVHAQLAANVIADRANELKRIEVLAKLMDSTWPGMAGAAHRGMLDPDAGVQRLAPSVAASLGLGGESDGE